MQNMAILIDKYTKVLVQGITGHQGRFHSRAMLDLGTKVVAGVTPGKSSERVNGIRVFDDVETAVKDRINPLEIVCIIFLKFILSPALNNIINIIMFITNGR